MTEPINILPTGGELSPQAFRDAMSRVAAAVHVVTTGGEAGRAGFTATAVASVSDAPPTLLVCFSGGSRSAAVLGRNGVFCVNTLSADDQHLADVFAGRAGLQSESRFAHGTWDTLATGAPVLGSALAAFDCRVLDSLPAGGHLIMVGRIEAVRIGAERPALLYKDRHYARI